jgi:hypothetical protein
MAGMVAPRPGRRTRPARAAQSATMGDWGMARLFVAVRPPPEVMARLAAIDRPALPGVRWSVPEQWLVKLRPLGHVDGRVV